MTRARRALQTLLLCWLAVAFGVRLAPLDCAMHAAATASAGSHHDGASHETPAAPCQCGDACQVPAALQLCAAPTSPEAAIVAVDQPAWPCPGSTDGASSQVRLPFATPPPLA